VVTLLNPGTYTVEVTGSGFKTLNEGEEVNFEVVSSDKGPKAQNVQRVPG